MLISAAKLSLKVATTFTFGMSLSGGDFAVDFVGTISLPHQE